MSGRPIGEKAMTATERQRRWRAKVRAGKLALQPVTVARLQARIRELEIERAQLALRVEKLGTEVGRFMHVWGESWTLNKARIHEVEAELAGERARRETPADIAGMPTTYRKKYEAVRQGLERAFKDRVRQEAHRMLDELFLADAHSSLDNVLDGREPRVPRTTGYRDLRPTPHTGRNGARAIKY
jgi:hypothetical protein